MRRTVGFAVAMTTALAAMTASAQAPAPAAKPLTLIHAGTLLAVPGQAPKRNATIVVRDGRIAEVRDGFATESGARIIDLRDQFVLPGLIDMHVHITRERNPNTLLEAVMDDPEDSALSGAYFADKTLQAGFTTVRELGAQGRAIVALRDSITAGRLAGPTIVPAASSISISAGHGDVNGYNRVVTRAMREEANNVCNGAESCRQAVRNQIGVGAEVIKFAATGGVNSNVAGGLAQQMFDDEMKAIVDTAHMFGRKVAAHAHGKDGIEAALKAGVDSIEHGTFTDDETIALFKKTGAYLVPTVLAPQTVVVMAKRGEMPPASAAKALEAGEAHFRNTSRAIKAGVKIAFGTDTGVSRHGFNAQEFRLLVEAGMTPMQAIRSATVNAADLLGRSATIGTIEPGKDADIVAVARSPLDDVTELERVQFVMRRGTVHKLGGERQVFSPR